MTQYEIYHIKDVQMTRLLVQGVGVRCVKTDALDWLYSHLCHKMTSIWGMDLMKTGRTSQLYKHTGGVTEPVGRSGLYAKTSSKY